MSSRYHLRQCSCLVFRRAFVGMGLVALLLIQFGPVWAVAGEQKGVFKGDHVGCNSKADLFAYYDARQKENRTAMSKMIAERKCLTLKGLSYVPLRVGFVTARVRVTYQETEITLWARSVAVVESPPPPRDTHFNF